jgi:hypothetical protein
MIFGVLGSFSDILPPVKAAGYLMNFLLLILLRWKTRICGHGHADMKFTEVKKNFYENNKLYETDIV